MMTPLQMRRMQEKRLRRRKREKSKRNTPRLTSFDVAEFELAIANLPEQDQVLWMRFVLGAEHVNIWSHGTNVIAVYAIRCASSPHINCSALLKVECWIPISELALPTYDVIVLACYCGGSNCHFYGYASHWLTTMDGIAKAAVNGVRQYFKAVC